MHLFVHVLQVNIAIDVIMSGIAAQGYRTDESLQRAAEALAQEAYMRGSTDNIGVCIVALEN
jgi:serine/threonine protein phosphatase PrpC